jgi:hypothetical protein
MNDKLFDSLLEHLYLGHTNMKYGLYFSLMYTENDIEFCRLNTTNKNDIIIQYIKFDDFIEHVKELNNTYNFDSSILYINSL